MGNTSMDERQRGPQRLSPCITPTGFVIVMPGMRKLLAREAAHLQGFGSSELDAMGCLALEEKDLLDLVGNAFTTTILSSVLVASLLAWDRG
jgi:hypothetical protein